MTESAFEYFSHILTIEHVWNPINIMRNATCYTIRVYIQREVERADQSAELRVSASLRH